MRRFCGAACPSRSPRRTARTRSSARSRNTKCRSARAGGSACGGKRDHRRKSPPRGGVAGARGR